MAHVSNALGTVLPVAELIAWRTTRAPSCCSTAPRLCRTSRSTCRRSTVISTPSAGTSCTDRPASVCSTAKSDCSRSMPPYQGGGDMIRSVTFEETIYNELPYKFEAGTPEHCWGDRARGRGRLLQLVRSSCRPCPRERRASLRDRRAANGPWASLDWDRSGQGCRAVVS